MLRLVLILAPGHVLLEGVSDVAYSGFVQNVGLAPGATAIARWNNNEYFLAANENVVGLNILPSLGNGGSFQWTGQLATIYQNAVRFLSGPSFLSVSPTSASLAPGESIDLTATFDSHGLSAGQYQASVDISSNDPGHPVVGIPAVLNVLGPKVTVSPDSLYAEVEQGGTVSQVIHLNNIGDGSYTYEATVQLHGSSGVVEKKQRSLQQLLQQEKQLFHLAKMRQQDALKLTSTVSLAIATASANGRQRTNETVLSVDQYATGFEGFRPW